MSAGFSQNQQIPAVIDRRYSRRSRLRPVLQQPQSGGVPFASEDMLTVGYRIWFAVLLVLAGFGFPSNLFARGVLNIPRAVSIPDLFTGIAIGNPASTEVTATFTAYQADGTPLATAGNPVTLTIPAAGQIARNFGDLFGTKAPFNGWVQVTSAAALTGFFLNSNYALTDFDGSGVGDPSAEFILPLASSDGTSV